METPNTLVNQGDKVAKKLPLKKTLLVILSLTVIGGIIYYLLPIAAHYFPFLKNAGIKPKVEPQLIRQSNLQSITTRNHPQVFYAELEFDPNSNSITQRIISTTNQDQISYLDRPSQSPLDFNYRIEVTTKDGKTLATGWLAPTKEIITTSDNKLTLRFTAPYQKDALVRLYLPNNTLIWTGEMN